MYGVLYIYYIVRCITCCTYYIIRCIARCAYYIVRCITYCTYNIILSDVLRVVLTELLLLVGGRPGRDTPPGCLLSGPLEHHRCNRRRLRSCWIRVHVSYAPVDSSPTSFSNQSHTL